MKDSLLNQNIAEVQISYSTKVPAKDRLQVKTSASAADALRLVYPGMEHKEYFYVLLLNRANRILGYYQVSSGGLTGTVVDQRIVFQAAIKANASSMILAHNHPSGQLIPSQADIDLTRKIKASGEIMDIPVLDHLIMTEESYYSFADEGLL